MTHHGALFGVWCSCISAVHCKAVEETLVNQGGIYGANGQMRPAPRRWRRAGLWVGGIGLAGAATGLALLLGPTRSAVDERERNLEEAWAVAEEATEAARAAEQRIRQLEAQLDAAYARAGGSAPPAAAAPIATIT